MGQEAQEPPLAAAHFPTETPEPPPGTFELGLVLGGTVSAGAYTAGALDFLIEALEAWEADPDRKHRVVLKSAGGSSGGAVCGAILGLLSGRPVPHIHRDTAAAQQAQPADTGNPLFDLWVRQFDIKPFLELQDIEPPRDIDAGTGAAGAAGAPVQHVPSFISSALIEQAGAALVTFAEASQPRALPHFAAPFRVAVTVTNLRGIPYRIASVPELGAFRGAAYMQHDDFAWFAFANGADPGAPLPAGRRQDEFWLDPCRAGEDGFAGYQTLVDFGSASGALPLGLAARALSRPVRHYDYRPNLRPVTDTPDRVRVDWPRPIWDEMPDTRGGTYAFTAVDGGTLNNDPVSLVHRSLAGLIGRNPRCKSDARRAILMIDPLADGSAPIAPTGKSLFVVSNLIVPTFVGGSRYLTADMDLFADDDVFSRFQLVPFRTDRATVGEAALAGSTLFAAAGWCCPQFRLHDFLLGRHNMQLYLRNELLLAGDNPLFADWTEGEREDQARDVAGTRLAVTPQTPRASYFLPVIPDKTGLQPALPEWPVNACDPAAIEGPLSSRLERVLQLLVRDNGGTVPWLLSLLAIDGAVGLLVTRILESWRRDLRSAGLLQP